MNSASLADMNSRIAAQANKKQTAGGRKGVTVGSMGELSRFRPNLLVGGPSIHAYAEDAWQELKIGTQRFFTAGKDNSYICWHIYDGFEACCQFAALCVCVWLWLNVQ